MLNSFTTNKFYFTINGRVASLVTLLWSQKISLELEIRWSHFRNSNTNRQEWKRVPLHSPSSVDFICSTQPTVSLNCNPPTVLTARLMDSQQLRLHCFLGSRHRWRDRVERFRRRVPAMESWQINKLASCFWLGNMCFTTNTNSQRISESHPDFSPPTISNVNTAVFPFQPLLLAISRFTSNLNKWQFLTNH